MDKEKYRELKFYISTLGCKVNQAESNAISNYLVTNGAVSSNREEASIIIINSCAVTVQAGSKSRHELRALKRENPEALIILMGCYVEQDSIEEEVKETASVLIGTKEKARVYDVIETYLANEKILIPNNEEVLLQFEELKGFSDGDRTRAQVKIQDGCENFCSYCIIPYLRGPERSRTKDSIISEINHLDSLGYKEVVLTGIHLGSYGRDKGESFFLYDLLIDILAQTDIMRVRLSSLEPNDVNQKIIRLIKEEDRLLPHLHIPLQSGSDKILSLMNRKYTIEWYRDLIKDIRGAIPEISITTDLIVGFPGETDEDFIDIMENVKEISFSQIHIFRYSQRPNTPAANMKDQIHGDIAKSRSNQIRSLAKEMGLDYTKQMIGKTYNVLFEQKLENDIYVGHADNYVKVFVNTEQNIENSIRKVKIIKNYPYSVSGVMI
jgi:threonylcarbamoyladenosine tRNA methylthiotransferase MtaB